MAASTQHKVQRSFFKCCNAVTAEVSEDHRSIVLAAALGDGKAATQYTRKKQLYDRRLTVSRV